MICVPPTSGVLVVTPGISWPTANGSFPVGIVSSISRLITDCDTELRTSTSGDSPVTVIDLLELADRSSAFTVAVNAAERRMPSRFTGLEAGEREGHRVVAGPQIDDLVRPLLSVTVRARALDEHGARRLHRHARQHGA